MGLVDSGILVRGSVDAREDSNAVETNANVDQHRDLRMGFVLGFKGE